MKIKYSDLNLEIDQPSKVEQYQSYFEEIFYKKEYEFKEIKINKGDVVVDCGASIGIFASYALTLQASKIYCFEADPNVFLTLNKNFTSNDNVKTYQKIVGENLSLNQIFETINEKFIGFLKIDIEGWEYNFLLNANTNLLRRIKKIVIEFHVWNTFVGELDLTKKMIEIQILLNKIGYNCYLTNLHPNCGLYMMYAVNLNKG